LSKMSGSFFLHRAQAHTNKEDYKGTYRWLWLGAIFGRPFLVVVVPSFIALLFGELVINNIIAFIPAWIITGMNCAGHVLPALGVAILLRYLPIKQGFNFIYLIVGFVCAAYLNLPTLATALIGFVLATLVYANAVKGKASNEVIGGGMEDE
jgi:PTS system mannose-specific IIC component